MLQGSKSRRRVGDYSRFARMIKQQFALHFWQPLRGWDNYYTVRCYKQAIPNGIVEILNLYREPTTNGVVNIKPRRGFLFIETVITATPGPR
jgi:hypothetical protein